jgi:hypothetical protein
MAKSKQPKKLKKGRAPSSGTPISTTTIPQQSGASGTGNTKEMTTVDTSAVVTEMTTMDETILPKGAPTTAIANAIAGTPQNTTIANKTTSENTIANKTTTENAATAAAMTESSITYQSRSVGTVMTKTNDTTIEKGAAIATTTDVTKKDATIDTSADTMKDTTIDTGAAIGTTTNVTKNNDERNTGMPLGFQAMSAKNARTTMPENNNTVMTTSTPIAATSPSGSVSNHGSSKYDAGNDLGQTSEGNEKVSIISDMILFPK